MTAAQRERRALVETMRTVGPDAPTLCGDWTEMDSVGRAGDYTSVSNLWTDQSYVNCDQEGHIYCVQTLQ